jgi:hypothetical protein
MLFTLGSFPPSVCPSPTFGYPATTRPNRGNVALRLSKLVDTGDGQGLTGSTGGHLWSEQGEAGVITGKEGDFDV